MNLQEMGQAQQPVGQKPATPEQQAQFDLLLGRARQVMGENGAELMLALKTDPVRMAVMFGTRTLRELAIMSEKAGQPVDPAVLIHVGLTLIKDIAGLANEAGLVPDDQLEDFMRQVTQESLAEYMRMDADDGLLQGASGGGDPAPAPANVIQKMQGGAA